MERENFKGTGYQCLGKMIENNFYGVILTPTTTLTMFGAQIRDSNSSVAAGMFYLKQECEYVYPAEYYKEVTCYDALEAALAGIGVEYRDVAEINYWCRVSNINLPFWGSSNYKFRVIKYVPVKEI